MLEPAFPGTLEYNDRPTTDDVVRIEIHDREHRFLKYGEAAVTVTFRHGEGTAQKVADLSLGEVESAASSARMFANLVAEKKRRAVEQGRKPRANEEVDQDRG